MTDLAFASDNCPGRIELEMSLKVIDKRICKHCLYCSQLNRKAVDCAHPGAGDDKQYFDKGTRKGVTK